MNRFSTLILGFLLVVGTTLTLIQLYASADGLQHPFTASLYYFGTSVIIILLIIKSRNDISIKHVILNNIIISIFTINGIVLALICLYALEPQSNVESLASSIFFFAGMLASSSVFFVRSKIKNSTIASNKNDG